MSPSIIRPTDLPLSCFPAKLSHGHIKALSQMELDAIFYPCLTYNVDEGLGDNHGQSEIFDVGYQHSDHRSLP